MKAINFYKYAAGGLLLLNLLLVGFLYIGRPPAPPNSATRMHHIKEALHLDKTQRTAFEKLAKAHHQQMRAINKAQREVLEPYFLTLISTTTDINPEDVLTQVERLERQKITLTYNHFKEVKNLLRPDQMKFYEQFTKVALQTILLKSPVNPPPEKTNAVYQ